MDNPQPPERLYYTTVEFEDGSMESPHFLCFDGVPEGILMVKDHYANLKRPIAFVTLKEMVYVESVVLPEDTQILVPTNDYGLEDDFADPDARQEAVESAEQSEREALEAVFPDEQEIDQSLCRAFYMGPFVSADTGEEYIQALQNDPMEISLPIDYVWLYRPTGAEKRVEG